MSTIVAAPAWVDVLLLVAVASALPAGLVMLTDVGQQALVDQWERTATAFGRPMSDADYAGLIRLSDRYGWLYAAGMALLTGPGLSLLAGLGLGIAARGRAVAFARGASAPTTMTQALAVGAHAGVILALRQLVAAGSTYARETTASATTIGALFRTLDEASPGARLLGALDLLVIWWLIVLAIGTGLVLRRPAKKVTGFFVGIYAALALLLAIVMAVTGGSA